MRVLPFIAAFLLAACHAVPPETAPPGTDIAWHLDPELPEWMSWSLRRHLPDMLAVYTERFDMPLEGPLRVTVDFHGGAGEGLLTGEARADSIHVGVHGDRWLDDDPWAVERFHRLLAHEAAHLWNAGLVRFRPGTPSWLYEGGSDALADRVMLALGLVDEARFAELQDAVRERCETVEERRDYTCGNLMAGEAERRSLAAGGGDLFGLWAELLARARSGPGSYGEDDWAALLPMEK